MTILETLKSNSDLTRDDVFNEHIRALQANVELNRFSDAAVMYVYYEQWLLDHADFKETYIDKFNILQRLILENKWLCFRILFQPDALELFNQHIMVLLNMGQEFAKQTLTEQLRLYILHLPIFFDERDPHKLELAKALSSNEESVTTALFYRGIKEASPTIKNWFSEYVEYMGSYEFSQYQRKRFFQDNENARRLSKEDQARLTVLFQTYQQLKRSSYMVKGLEEELDYTGKQGEGKMVYGEVQPWSEEIKDRVNQVLRDTKLYYEEQKLPVPKYLLEALEEPSFFHGDIMGMPKVDIEATKGPDYFSEQDQADILTQTEKNQLYSAPASANYTERAQRLIIELQLSFTTPEVEKKFKQLLETVLRGLRDTMELRGYLEDMNFSDPEIEQVLDTIKGRVNGKPKLKTAASDTATINQPPASSLQKIKSQVNSADSNLSTSLSTTDMSLGENSINGAMPDIAMFNQTRPVSSAVSSSISSPNTDTAKKSFLPKLRRSRRTKRPLVDDVKIHQSMVMGPIDELHAMDLVEFRRLSPDPVVAAGKLKDKITLLGQETIGKQAEGLQAFRESILNQMYIEIGNSSIASGRAVADVIAERQTQGQITLSLNEFNAIADLNKELRF